MIGHRMIGSRPCYRVDNHLDDASRIRIIRFGLGSQDFLQDRIDDACSSFGIVSVAEFANALVTAWHIEAGLSLFRRAVVLAASAFIHVDAEAKSGGPFVTSFVTFAADVYLIRY